MSNTPTWSPQSIVDAAPHEQWDKNRWYATDLGGCMGGAYFKRKGVESTNPPDARSRRIMRMGKMMEDLIVQDIQKALGGDPDILLIDTQQRLEDLEHNASGRLDLLIISRSNPPILYEVKSVNSKAFWWMAKRDWQPNESHVLQINFYLKHLLPKYPDMLARIMYVSRDDLTIQEVPVMYDEEMSKRSDAKFKLLEKCFQEGVIPPVEPAVVWNEEGRKWGVNWKAKFCSHHALCMNDVEWEAKAEQCVAMLNAGEIKTPEEYYARSSQKANTGRKRKPKAD